MFSIRIQYRNISWAPDNILGRPNRERRFVAASPLSCIKLLNRGWGLRLVALLQLVSSVGDSTRDSVVPVHRMQVTGWSTAECGRFSAVSSAVLLPGAALGGALIQRLGNLRTLQLGLVGQVGQALLLARATVGRHFYWAQPVGTLTMCGTTALSALTMVEGDRAGLLQGELQGALSSLQMMVQVVAPFLWSRLHEAGVRAGAPGRFHLGMVVVQLARLLITALAPSGLGGAREAPASAGGVVAPASKVVPTGSRLRL